MRTRASITSGRAPRHAPRAVAPRGGGDETGVRAGQQSLPRSCRRHRRPAHFDQAPTTRFTPPHSPPPRAPASPPRTAAAATRVWVSGCSLKRLHWSRHRGHNLT